MILRNPLIKDNSKSRDPFITFWNGNYYSCYDGKDKVVVRKFSSFEEIVNAEEKIVYKSEGDMPIEWYAPEMHLIDGHWYIYGAPCHPNSQCHSMQVLRSVSDDPFSDYEYMGYVKGLEGKWSIDGNVFTYKDKLYMVVAMPEVELWICEMSDPLTLKGEPSPLIKAEYPWEKVMSPVVEGPFVLKKNNNLYIVYSASDSKCDSYCLGLLTFNGGDILDSNNWQKNAMPIFKSGNGLYGPGHCSFTKIGDKDIIVYHANTELNQGWTGSYLCAQPIDWQNDIPVLGEPLPEFEI